MATSAQLGTRILKLLDGRFPGFTSARTLRTEILSLDGNAVPGRDQLERIAAEVASHVRLFGGPAADQQLFDIEKALDGALPLVPRGESIAITDESSVVAARDRSGVLAKKLGFKATQWTRVVTAASELARNIVRYAGKGEITLGVMTRPQRGITIEARDQGPGIANLSEVMAGRVPSKMGMGMGLRGVKSLANEFAIRSIPGQGTNVDAVFYASGGAGAP